MKLANLAIALAGLLIAGRAAQAQDDGEKIKKKILEEVEKRLKAEEERILKEVEKIIDEELARWKRGEKKTNVEKKGGRAYLGIQPAELSDEERRELKIEAGIRVVEVAEGGPAAGVLRKDDVLLALDGKPVRDLDTLREIMAPKRPGDSLGIEYLRGDVRGKAAITLARHPEDRDEPKKEEERDSLRERIRKFLDRQDREERREDKKAEKKPEDPSEGDDFFALDDEAFDRIRPLLEQFGLNPEDYFEKGKDGKWRPNAELRELFKQFDLRKFFEKGQDPGKQPEEKKEEKKSERKEEKKEERKSESSKPAWLGVVPGELSDEDRAHLDLEAGVGLAIVEVRPGSPAEKAGLKKGDILVKLDGKKLRGEEGLQKFMQTAKAGQACEATVVRDGREKTLKVVLAERKD